MKINDNKSTITTVGCSIHETAFAIQRFPFNSLNLSDGIKYLGFRLKPLGYRISDWTWLIAKVQKRLLVWYHKYLSRARRLVFIKVVIEATPVYWMALAWILKGILNRLQSICCRFLWKGSNQGNLFAWVKWDTIAKPKKWGGWGIKRLDLFANALATKMGWQLLTSNSLWQKVVVEKYIAPESIFSYIRREHRGTGSHSIIWKVVLNSLPLIREGLTWRIKQGNSVRIGIDPWIGCGNMQRL